MRSVETLPAPPATIRPCRPNDHDRVVAIWRAAVAATHDFLSPHDRAGIDADACAYLRTAPLWLAVDARDTPVGFMGLSADRLEALFVDPDQLRRGVGRALVAWAAERNPVLHTEVNLQNPEAAAFYRRMGFVEIGSTPVDDYGRPYPLLRLRRDATDGIHVRPARPADIPLLPDIETSAVQAFLHTAHAWVAQDGFTDLDIYPPLLASATLWIAEIEGRPVGFLGAWREGPDLHILELAVALPCQHRGCGRRLMRAAISTARARGLDAVTLTTFADVAFNAPFYRSLGFESVSDPGPRLAGLLAHEARRGLRNRCAMRRRLGRPNL